jgi:hypothetical protein
MSIQFNPQCKIFVVRIVRMIQANACAAFPGTDIATSLQGGHGGEDRKAESHTRAKLGRSAGELHRCSRRREAAGANDSRRRGHQRGGLDDWRTVGGRRRDDDDGAGRRGSEADLRDGDGCLDNLGGAGSWDDGTRSLAGDDSSGGEDHGRVLRGGHGWRRSSGDDGRDGLGAGDDGRVLRCVRCADALEEDNGLRDDLVRLAMGVDAAEDVLDKDGIGAVAGSIGVVRAREAEEPGVQAAGDDTGARESLDRAGGLGRGGRDRDEGRGRGLLLNWLSRGLLLDRLAGRRGRSGGDGLRDGAHGRGERYNNGGESNGLARAVGHSRRTACDSRDNSREDGRGAEEAGDVGRRRFRRGGCLALNNQGTAGRAGLDGRRAGRRGLLGRRAGGGGGRSNRLGAGKLDLSGRSRLHLNRLGTGRSRFASGCGLGRDRRVAVERDGVDADAAGLLGLLGLGRIHNGNVLGAAALGVLDGGATLGASRAVLAGRAVGHVIVELEVAVELDRDVEVDNGEPVHLGLCAAAEAGRLLLVGRARAGNDPVAEGARGKGVSLGELVLALEALEVKAAVVTKLARIQVLPVEAALLLVVALIVGVGWARESGSIVEAKLCLPVSVTWFLFCGCKWREELTVAATSPRLAAKAKRATAFFIFSVSNDGVFESNRANVSAIESEVGCFAVQLGTKVVSEVREETKVVCCINEGGSKEANDFGLQRK